MNNLPDITIVIPTLDRPKRLLKAKQAESQLQEALGNPRRRKK